MNMLCRQVEWGRERREYSCSRGCMCHGDRDVYRGFICPFDEFWVCSSIL